MIKTKFTLAVEMLMNLSVENQTRASKIAMEKTLKWQKRVVKKETCEDCGTEIIENCQICGAPNCCPRCCKEATDEMLRQRNLDNALKKYFNNETK